MILEMKGICKRFGENAVLDHARFSLAAGEVHALMGENGAGKSTLMKILAGEYEKDSGTVYIGGRETVFSHPREAEAAGICFVHQELNSLPDMTVEENLFAGREITRAFGVLDRGAMRRGAEKAMRMLGSSLAIDMPLRGLSVGQRQLVEIARAFLCSARIIILDEPTAALTEAETAKLFEVIGKLKTQGISFVYISHRMEEIFKLCDRITVMRDGKFIAEKDAAETTENELIKLMIGRDLGKLFDKPPAKPGAVLLEVRGLSKKGAFRDISFSVRAGEILGFGGLMGAGRTELMKAIFGADKADRGTVRVRGNPIPLKKHNPAAARRLGMAFITEDRKNEGILPEETIMKDISAVNFPRIARWNIINGTAEKRIADDAIADFRVKCSGRNQKCGDLSGGNQQKVIFAKWLLSSPSILILDEPTRGIDVGSKQEIYAMISRFVRNGAAVIMVSSEMPELLGMSDRIAVMHEGSIAGILKRCDASEDAVMKLAAGGNCNAETA
ncbi:MAG: sugar ABC transporter ATP-binding protein [Bacteroides sp.]|nr:sugar ABC transporter ATP-binding protein [Prevotella sp.]MCM1406909.1 sugar ABC transporter ATP-binding protein [Treponema brennaborense]MCM1470060.1 sugar ABC transporter ATP-binding protein [Bacteroides sp.]